MSRGAWVNHRRRTNHALLEKKGRAKVAYATRAEAESHIPEHAADVAARMVAYQCEVCGSWHLSSRGDPDWDALYVQYRRRMAEKRRDRPGWTPGKYGSA